MATLRVPKVTKDDNIQLVIQSAQRLAQDIDTPVSLSVHLLLKYKEYGQIAEKSVDPSQYLDSESFNLDYTITSLLRKWELLPTGIDTEEVAFNKFIDAERACESFNISMWNADLTSSKDLDRANFLFKVSREIRHILGDCPKVHELDCNFGPGATSACSGESVTLPHKLDAELQCTREAKDIFLAYLKGCPIRTAAFFGTQEICGRFSPLAKFKIVKGNKLTFVPKTSKTDRAICIEPHLNIFLQKGVGSYIRQRLLLNGLDLRKQADINAVFARRGSIDGSYATIDLAAASDTISSSLVHSLLDESWFDLLYNLRSHFTDLGKGHWLENEKFSSMGNGYTFELESLIFYAILRVVKRDLKSEGRVMTYGDDIIVPTEIAQACIDRLTTCGFTVNESKSFVSGPFRESCGKDYFLGQLVRPYFLKKRWYDLLDIYPVLNGLRHCAVRSYDGVYADKRFRSTWNFLLSKIPSRLRFYGPGYHGDSVIYTNRKRGIVYQVEGMDKVRITERVCKKVSLSDSFTPSTVLCAALAGQPEKLPVRGNFSQTKTRSTAAPSWDRFDAAWSL